MRCDSHQISKVATVERTKSFTSQLFNYIPNCVLVLALMVCMLVQSCVLLSRSYHLVGIGKQTSQSFAHNRRDKHIFRFKLLLRVAFLQILFAVDF